MPRFDLTAIGEGQLRYSVPVGARLEQARSFDVHVSGSEANVGCTLARLGWRCGWVSSLPDTPLGRRVANHYRAAGLDLSAVLWSDEHRLATYYVEYAAPPRATRVLYDRAGSCFTHLDADAVDWEYLLDTRVLHLSGITAALCENVYGTVRDAIRRAGERGVKVGFDVNHRSRLWSPAEARAALEPLVREVDLLFCSRRDAATVFGIEGDDAAVVEQLHALSGADLIVVSVAERGILGFDGTDLHRVPAHEVVIVDRIGAGDAMVAGVLHGYLQNPGDPDVATSLRYGALTAALALVQHGDLPWTDRRELEALLRAAGGDIVR